MQLGVGCVLMKDEGARMGLKAFKALGVGFALSQEITRPAELENILMSNHKFRYFHILNPNPQFPPLGFKIANLFGLFDKSCWAIIFITFVFISNTFKLLEYIAKKMGYTSREEELPFFPMG